MEQYGIEKLKKALGAVIGLGMTTVESLEDDKITTGEWVKISFSALKLAAALRDIKGLKLEWNDLSESEKEELKSYANTEFDIPNDETEAFIEEAFAVLLSILTGFKKKAA